MRMRMRSMKMSKAKYATIYEVHDMANPKKKFWTKTDRVTVGTCVSSLRVMEKDRICLLRNEKIKWDDQLEKCQHRLVQNKDKLIVLNHNPRNQPFFLDVNNLPIGLEYSPNRQQRLTSKGILTRPSLSWEQILHRRRRRR